MVYKCLESFFLKYLFSLIGKEDCITVKGNTDFIWVRLRCFAGLWINLSSGKASINRSAHIILIRGEK